MERPKRPFGTSSNDDEKVQIEFIERENRIRGTSALLFIREEDGYVGNKGNGKYIISTHLQNYLREKGIEFQLIPLPPKLRGRVDKEPK